MKFTGTGVALITPFREDKSVDFTALTNLVNSVTAGGVNFLVVLGTTGESVTLSESEKQAVVNHIIEINASKLPIVLGMGGNNTKSLTDTIKNTDFTGIDGILSVAPYYNKPSQEGLYLHYKEIAQASPVPIILYNVPGRTSSNISAQTTLRLANEFQNITAIKEASGNFTQIMQIIKNKPAGFTVLSGDDAITLPLISIGMSGVISVVANAFPSDFSKMINEALDGNYETAKKLHYKLLDIINSLFKEGNPGGIKAALKILSNDKILSQKYVRLPLVPASDKLYADIENLIKNI